MNWKSRNLAAAALAVSLLLLPLASEAKERRGARLLVEKLDGARIEDELLKVSGETLFLFLNNGRGTKVQLREIDRLGLPNKGSALGGMGIGLLAGIGAGLVAGKLFASKEPCEGVSFYMASVGIGIPLGMLIGGVSRGFKKRFKNRPVKGLDEAEMSILLAELNGLARDVQPLSGRTMETKDGNAN